MGMYTYRYPFEKTSEYALLIPGGEHKKAINLSATGPIANMVSWSIQAMSSGKVTVKCWISNFLRMPFTEETEHRNWKVPSPTPVVGDLWIPCASIPDFVVSPGENYFKQGDWNDTCQYLMFQLSPDYPPDSKKYKDALGNPVDRVAFSLAITFR